MLRTTVLAFAAVAVVPLAALAGDGIEPIPYGEGGLQWNVSAQAQETPYDGYGEKRAEGYVMPPSVALRPGCFANSPSSPWILVGHASGFGQFVPDIKLRWHGVLYPKTGELYAPVVNLQVQIRKAGGAIRTQWAAIDTGHLTLHPIYYPPDGGVLYSGELDNGASSASPFLVSFDVEENDEVRVRLCDLVGGSSMTVRSLIVRTIPIAR